MNPTTLSPEQLLDLGQRYVEVWNEPDAELRRRRVDALWSPDGTHYVRTLVAHGHEQLAQRVASSHDKNVRQNGYRFRLAGEPQQLQGHVLMHWDMVRPGVPTLEAYGAVFISLSPDGRIATDYQFVLPTPRG